MGSSWSVYLAQLILEDILTGSLGNPLRETGLIGYGFPIAPAKPLKWNYIDDFALAALQRLWRFVERERAEILMGEARDLLRAAGFDVHTVQLGAAIESFGIELASQPPRACAKQDKTWAVELATRAILTAGAAWPEAWPLPCKNSKNYPASLWSAPASAARILSALSRMPASSDRSKAS